MSVFVLKGKRSLLMGRWLPTITGGGLRIAKILLTKSPGRCRGGASAEPDEKNWVKRKGLASKDVD